MYRGYEHVEDSSIYLLNEEVAAEFMDEVGDDEDAQLMHSPKQLRHHGYRPVAPGDAMAYGTPAPTAEAPVSDILWNERFQAALSAAGHERDSLLANLGKDFCAHTEAYARIILSEIHLPLQRKTLQPRRMGGELGGVKYCANGVMYKLASQTRLFGSVEQAAKVSGHELKSLISIFNTGVPVRLPLMALHDFRGHRLLSIALLPVDDHTICYGSPDGGKTVHNDDPAVESLVQQVSKILNLKPHRVRDKTLCLSGDVEGHKGKDGRYYLLDLSRTFPPEYPLNRKDPTCIWSKLLRPELVVSFREPLSSDSLSNWGSYDRKINDSAVKRATRYLHEVVIPKVAQHIDVTVRSGRVPRVTEMIHEAGVNCRHLGHVWVHCREEMARRWVDTEMCVRAIKCYIRARQRNLMSELRLPLDQPFKNDMLQCLNLILSEDAYFWNEQLPKLVESKFGSMGGLAHVDHLAAVEKSPLLKRLLAVCGVQLTSKVKRALMDPDTNFLLAEDIVDVAVVTKTPNFVHWATGRTLVQRATSDLHPSQRIRVLKLAREHIVKASSCATSATLLQELAQVCVQLGLAYAKVQNGSKSAHFFREAAERIQQALHLDPAHLSTLVLLSQNVWNDAMTAKDSTVRSALVQGSATLYRVIFHTGLVFENAAFALQMGDILREAIIFDVAVDNMTPSHMCRHAALQLETAFNLEEALRFSLYAKICHENPSAEDRLFLASLIAVASYSEVLRDDLVQVFEGNLGLDLSYTGNLIDDDHLGYSPIGKAELLHHAQFCFVTLNLCSCRSIGDETAYTIGSRLPYIQHLNLSNTDIHDTGLKVIAEQCKLVSTLDLSNCIKVTDIGVGYLTHCCLLTSLSLRACGNITDVSLQRIIEGAFQELSSLYIQEIESLTYLQVRELVRVRPSISDLQVDHTSAPCYLSKDKLSRWVSLSEDQLIAMWTDGVECMILDEGDDHSLGLGICPRSHSLHGLPGWYAGSYGMHCDDGNVYSGNNMGTGTRFTDLPMGKGDVVGCGYSPQEGYLYFTLNGVYLGSPFVGLPSEEDFYCVVGSMSNRCRVKVIFDTNEQLFDSQDWHEREAMTMSSE